MIPPMTNEQIESAVQRCQETLRDLTKGTSLEGCVAPPAEDAVHCNKCGRTVQASRVGEYCKAPSAESDNKWCDGQFVAEDAPGESERLLIEMMQRDAVESEAIHSRQRRNYDKLQRFKSLTHELLDRMGIPVFAESECRIGARLDHIAATIAQLRERVKLADRLADCLASSQNRQFNLGELLEWNAGTLAALNAYRSTPTPELNSEPYQCECDRCKAARELIKS